MSLPSDVQDILLKLERFCKMQIVDYVLYDSLPSESSSDSSDSDIDDLCVLKMWAYAK